MSSALTPSLISEFKTGINTYLQPWIRPYDAFSILQNAYIYRGSIIKRNGYTLFKALPSDTNPIMGIMQWVNASDGTNQLVVASKIKLYYWNGTDFVAATASPTFTGSIANFFNWTNWLPDISVPSLLWLTNNKDKVTTYNGLTHTAAQPDLFVYEDHSDYISTCLDVKVYKERMLYISPTLNTGGVQPQSIYWSAQKNPTNVVNDVEGNGGFSEAPTSDLIQSCEFVRDVLVVFFTHSTWLFRFTGLDNDPFIWQKLNVSKNTNSPYSSISYDERCTSFGSTGLIACDAVNVQRYDIPIVDYYENEIQQKYYPQVFSQRYDNLNQSWSLYVSRANTFPVIGGVAPGSDRALIYNFFENTWATYLFTIPLTCLGTFYVPTSPTWQSLTNSWDSSDFPWAYYKQETAITLLAGDTTGNVWYMDNGGVSTDNGTHIPIEVLGTQWNPSIQLGSKLQFVYIDIYYQIVSTDPSKPVKVRINFYNDNSDTYAISKIMTLDGNVQGGKTFKRVYINLIGEFVQIEITQIDLEPFFDSTVQFFGFILWTKDSGRLTPP